MKHSSIPFYPYRTLCLSALLLVSTAMGSHASTPPDPATNAPTLPDTRALLASSTNATTPAGLTPVQFAPMPTAQAPAGVTYPAVDAAAIQPTIPAPLAAFPAPPVVGEAPASVPVALPVPAPVAAAPSAPAGGFIAPAPLVANSDAKSYVQSSQASAVAVNAEPQPGLSPATQKVLGRVPSKIGSAKPTKEAKVKLDRMHPDVDNAKGSMGKKDSVYEATGIKISVNRPGLDTNYELNRAYTLLGGGDSMAAAQVYKNILSAEPTSADALFGLATIYQRQGQINKARPLYDTLLQNHPDHRDGINNFLVLVSDESPQEALAELERLEQRNPDYSPIPAQQAMVLNKLGYGLEAREKMMRAIELSPDNLTYKYNLAVILDGQGDYPEAANLYRMLIDASSKGEKLPAQADAMQRRLNFIATAVTQAQPVAVPPQAPQPLPQGS